MTFTEPVQFAEAIQANRIKQALPNRLTSREISRLNSDLKRRSRLSAQLADLGAIDVIDRLVSRIAGGPSPEDFAARDRGEAPLLMSIPEAKAQILEYLRASGYQPNAGDVGTIKDHRTDRRLQLIVETGVLDTQGFGRHMAEQAPETLAVFPASELVRMKFSKVPRDWEERWSTARTATVADGATDLAMSGGRMIALKNHPIWQALGDPDLFPDALGNPWPPFAFNSGMNVIDVRREAAVELGLMTERTKVPPDTEDRGMNDNLKASVQRHREALQRALEEDASLQILDGILTLRAQRTGNRGGGGESAEAVYPAGAGQRAARPASAGQRLRRDAVAGMRSRAAALLQVLRTVNAQRRWPAGTADGLGGQFAPDDGGNRLAGGGNARRRESEARATIQRGVNAIREVASERRDVIAAMDVEDLGEIDFVWDRDGLGVKHIIKRREDQDIARPGMNKLSPDELLDRLPEVIVRGERTWLPNKITIDHKGLRVILARASKKRSSWMMSGYEDWGDGSR